MNLTFRLKLLIKRLRHFGPTRCPVCRSRVRMMSSGSGHARMVDLGISSVKRQEAVQCPICYTKERQRSLIAFLTEEVGLFRRRDIRVLHFAPEYWLGRVLPAALNGSYVPGDLNPDAYRHVRGIRRLDITGMDLPGASFDVVICSHVLEHVPDDGKAMQEIRRVLKPDGVATIMVPFAENLEGTDEDFSIEDPAERRRRFGQHDHCRVYGRDFPSRLRNAGFQVVEWNAERSGGPAFAERWRLSKSPEIVFVARPMI